MIKQMLWVERKFECKPQAGVFPSIVERFRGTPARLEDAVKSLSPGKLTNSVGTGWSIQEHAGHLLDLESMNEKRLQEFLAGAKMLSPADITNRKTSEAKHNFAQLVDILKQFRVARADLVRKLEQLEVSQVEMTSTHPRLNTPMRVIDWLYFMSEHDDHHLARIRELTRNS